MNQENNFEEEQEFCYYCKETILFSDEVHRTKKKVYHQECYDEIKGHKKELKF